MIRRTLLAGVLAAVFALTACGSGTPPTAAPSLTANFPASVSEIGGGTTTVTGRPTRIVSLSPTTTEMLFSIGAGKQVKAVDSLSDTPKSAPRTKLSGFTPNVEAIAGYDPDLVILSYDTNGVVKGLQKLKIPVYFAPAATTIADSYREIDDLGRLTGQQAGAAKTVRTMKTGIADAEKGLPSRAKPITYYYELDQQEHSVTSKTFIGSLFAPLGLTDIADPADKASDGGYPQLSAEYVVKADPDLIFLADTLCCKQSSSTVATRPGWSTVTAVRDHEVVPLNDDVASRWGPSVVQLVQAAATAVKSVPAQ